MFSFKTVSSKLVAVLNISLIISILSDVIESVLVLSLLYLSLPPPLLPVKSLTIISTHSHSHVILHVPHLDVLVVFAVNLRCDCLSSLNINPVLSSFIISCVVVVVSVMVSIVVSFEVSIVVSVGVSSSHSLSVTYSSLSQSKILDKISLHLNLLLKIVFCKADCGVSSPIIRL